MVEQSALIQVVDNPNDKNGIIVQTVVKYGPVIGVQLNYETAENLANKIYHQLDDKRPVAAIAGGFDPLHVGHLQNIVEAWKLGKVLVILKTDTQLIAKKGYVFMPYEERRVMMLSNKGVWKVVPAIDEDNTCWKSLELYYPDFFVKGGDRTPDNMPPEEIETCKKIGCEIVYTPGGALQSSSGLVQKIIDRAKSKP